MNRFIKIKAAFYSLLILLFFASFKPVNVSGGFGKKDWIPEDFNPRNVVLLIEEHPLNERWNNGMVKWLEKEYPWKFEIASLTEIQDNSKYQDKKVYQFAMLWSDIASRLLTNRGASSDGYHFTYHDLEGHFLDRSIDKEYPKSGYAMNRGMSAYKKIFSVLIKKYKDGKDDDK